jgi:hypothetical protein
MVAIIIGSVTVYIEFFKENKPDLNYIITANTSVLDIREKLGSLDVLYHGESLSKNKKDLRLITFEVINQGDTAILSNFYDSNDPVGFSIIDGKIADEPILIEASNKYLENKLVIEKRSDSSVLFSNVILEPSEFFKIKLLVLHDVSKNPTIESFGKVAGVNKIDVYMDFTSGNKRSFMEETFGGGIYPNITRFIAFGIAIILTMVLLIVTTEKIGDIKDKRRKNKLIQIFKEYETDKISEKDNFFFDYYLSRGAGFIKHLYDLLSDQEKLNILAKGEQEPRKRRRARISVFDDTSLLNELLSEGFIVVENDAVTVEPSRFSVLTDFFNFLKRKGEFRRGRDAFISHQKMILEMEEHNKLLKTDADKTGAD